MSEKVKCKSYGCIDIIMGDKQYDTYLREEWSEHVELVHPRDNSTYEWSKANKLAIPRK